MELKQMSPKVANCTRPSLNRTFYGIETRRTKFCYISLLRLNRTFYGIETL